MVCKSLRRNDLHSDKMYIEFCHATHILPADGGDGARLASRAPLSSPPLRAVVFCPRPSTNVRFSRISKNIKNFAEATVDLPYTSVIPPGGGVELEAVWAGAGVWTCERLRASAIDRAGSGPPSRAPTSAGAPGPGWTSTRHRAGHGQPASQRVASSRRAATTATTHPGRRGKRP